MAGGYIYWIINKETKECYVGQSIQEKYVRLKEHFLDAYGLRKSGNSKETKSVKQMIRPYPLSAFTILTFEDINYGLPPEVYDSFLNYFEPASGRANKTSEATQLQVQQIINEAISGKFQNNSIDITSKAGTEWGGQRWDEIKLDIAEILHIAYATLLFNVCNTQGGGQTILWSSKNSSNILFSREDSPQSVANIVFSALTPKNNKQLDTNIKIKQILEKKGQNLFNTFLNDYLTVSHSELVQQLISDEKKATSATYRIKNAFPKWIKTNETGQKAYNVFLYEAQQELNKNKIPGWENITNWTLEFHAQFKGSNEYFLQALKNGLGTKVIHILDKGQTLSQLQETILRAVNNEVETAITQLKNYFTISVSFSPVVTINTKIINKELALSSLWSIHLFSKATKSNFVKEIQLDITEQLFNQIVDDTIKPEFYTNMLKHSAPKSSKSLNNHLNVTWDFFNTKEEIKNDEDRNWETSAEKLKNSLEDNAGWFFNTRLDSSLTMKVRHRYQKRGIAINATFIKQPTIWKQFYAYWWGKRQLWKDINLMSLKGETNSEYYYREQQKVTLQLDMHWLISSKRPDQEHLDSVTVWVLHRVPMEIANAFKNTSDMSPKEYYYY